MPILFRFLPAKSETGKSMKHFYSIELHKGDIAIDCGANVGHITNYLRKSGATVYSFEPNPYAFKVLKNRFSNQKNVYCLNKGVSNKNGSMRLYFHEKSDQNEVKWSIGSSLLAFKNNVLCDKYIEVEIVDLSEFINSLDSRIRILKMDVEGVESKILKKIILNGTIDRIDYLFVETHDEKIPELASETNEVRKLLEEKGISNTFLDWR